MIYVSMLSCTHKLLDCGFKFGGALLKDFVAAFVILMLNKNSLAVKKCEANQKPQWL